MGDDFYYSESYSIEARAGYYFYKQAMSRASHVKDFYGRNR